MTINELIAELQDWVASNREPTMPDYDPGEVDVRVADEEGTYDSDILQVAEANGPWLIVDFPHDDCFAASAEVVKAEMRARVLAAKEGRN